MRKYLLAIPLAILVGPWTKAALADSVPIGQISFDNTIPAAPGVPGINSFDLLNLTGGLTDPTGPGVIDTITLSGQLILLEFVDGNQISHTVPFASAGLLTTDLFDVPSNVQILSATLTGTLDQTVVTLNGGSSLVTLSSSFTVTDPFNGNVPLTACDGTNTCSQALLSANTSASTSTVPEPETLLLLGSGLAPLLLWKRRYLKG